MVNLVARLLPFAFLALVVAQRTTIENAAGNSVVLSIVTDADGDPSSTRTLSTITVTDTATATTTPNQGNDLVPESRCTTDGCTPDPTTYTLSGEIVTWFATTPTTPIPTWTSSGSVLAASQYASVIVSASGIAEATAKGSSASPNFGFASQWGGMALVGLVGGLVGALVVL